MISLLSPGGARLEVTSTGVVFRPKDADALTVEFEWILNAKIENDSRLIMSFTDWTEDALRVKTISLAATEEEMLPEVLAKIKVNPSCRRMQTKAQMNL